MRSAATWHDGCTTMTVLGSLQGGDAPTYTNLPASPLPLAAFAVSLVCSRQRFVCTTLGHAGKDHYHAGKPANRKASRADDRDVGQCCWPMKQTGVEVPASWAINVGNVVGIAKEDNRRK